MSWILSLPYIRNCHKVSLYAICRKKYDPNSIKWQKTSFWVWFRYVGPKPGLPTFFSKTLASSVTRYHGQLPCAISEKTNYPISRKLSDVHTDRRTDRQTDKSDFIGMLSDYRRASNRMSKMISSKNAFNVFK